MKKVIFILFIIASFIAFLFLLPILLDMNSFNSNFSYANKITIINGDEIIAWNNSM